MRKELKRVLNLTNIPNTSVKRPEDSFPYIVYTIKDFAGAFADNKEESSKYDIYLNLYIKQDINDTVDEIKKIMNDNGFTKVVINDPVMFDGLDYYQVTFNYTKYKSNN
ncbi:hypothetical protein [Romboutsia timonensis]|uniref:hypothetical protein n=1 Tax=Romboutsia timonensis TaxID=1776391 RepID=UPI002A81B701|nr:hypothetical protein [Romboutsia timonensis]MDY3960170.1 hypothetical protein [Romboutsia timonensis]